MIILLESVQIGSYRREDMLHYSIKEKLNRIIIQYFAGILSYSQAKHKIEETIDWEVEKVEQENKTLSESAYKIIVALGEAKKNAFVRLKRRKKNLERPRKPLYGKISV